MKSREDFVRKTVYQGPGERSGRSSLSGHQGALAARSSTYHDPNYRNDRYTRVSGRSSFSGQQGRLAVGSSTYHNPNYWNARHSTLGSSSGLQSVHGVGSSTHQFRAPASLAYPHVHPPTTPPIIDPNLPPNANNPPEWLMRHYENVGRRTWDNFIGFD